MSNLTSSPALWRARARWGPRLPSADTRYELLGLFAAFVMWSAIVVLAEPYGRQWGTGQDAYCYYQATLADPYARSDWTSPIAYVYSPAFIQLVAPLTRLPWQAFIAVWTLILLVGVRFLTGPKLFALGVIFAAMELAGGNIEILIAVAMVVGFRWPAAWGFVLLTKVTPGVGLLWFAVRREWNELATALVATGMIVAASAVFMPSAWSEWFTVLSTVSGRDGTWAAVPIPLMGAPAGRSGHRGVGRDDELTLDGAGRRHGRAARPVVRGVQHAAGDYRIAPARMERHGRFRNGLARTGPGTPDGVRRAGLIPAPGACAAGCTSGHVRAWFVPDGETSHSTIRGRI